MRPQPLAAIFATLLATLAGCTLVDDKVGPCAGPPPAPIETTPEPPASDQPLRFQPGHWEREGISYRWVPGVWIKQLGLGMRWAPGYSDRPDIPGPCLWHPAHWV